MTTPLTVEIDFAQLRRTMEKTYPVGPNGHLFFSVSVVVSDDLREAIWELPIEAVPQGLATLKEGDGRYDHFLHIARRGPHD